jgi:hypothetical protein
LSSFFFEYGIVKAKCEGSPMISKALYPNTPTEPELETFISPIVEQIIRELFEPGETMATMSRKTGLHLPRHGKAVIARATFVATVARPWERGTQANPRSGERGYLGRC